MKIIRIIILLSLAIFIGGCDDDPELTSPPFTTNSVRTVVVAKATLNPGLSFYAFIQPVYGQELEIDSVKIGDSLCTINKKSAFVDGNNYSYNAAYSSGADSTRFNPGDSISIKFFQSGEVLTRSVILLDQKSDKPIFIPSASDYTVDKGEDILITWNKIENADWYGIRLKHATGSIYISTHYYEQISTTDSFLVIPGNNHDYDGYYTILIQAVSGPIPDIDDPNLNSFFISGAFYSYSEMSTFRITVGDGESEL